MLQSRQSLLKGFCLTGLLVLAVGLIFHFSVPGTSRGGYALEVDGESDLVETISLDLGSSDYSFRIEVIGLGQSVQSNCSAYLLDSVGYDLYQGGTPLDNIDSLLVLIEESRAELEFSTDGTVELFLVISNSDANQSIWAYYLALLPESFYPSLTIAFSGAFLCLVATAGLLHGWKRYIIVGIAINLVFFFLRTLTLSTYSLGIPPIFEEVIHVELYNDYQFFYLSWVPRLWQGVWPYSAEMAAYIYPPLWIYTVSLFGNTPPWFPGFVLFSFNVGTAYFVYKIARILSEDEKRAIMAMMLYFVNPFTLLYGSFMWLNPTPFVFFTVCAYYFALKKNGTYAFAALAVATLYKQFAVAFFPLLVVYLIKQKANSGHRAKLAPVLKHTFIYCFIVGVVSIPFMLADASTYLGRMILWNSGSYERLTVFIPDLWMPVHANTFFLWLGAPTWLTDTIAFLLINYVFLILCGIFVYGTFALTRADDSSADVRSLFSNMLVWGLVAILCIQIFFPRGSYKFYLLALSPFVALLFDHENLSYRNKMDFKIEKRHLLGLFVSWAIFLCYRFVYFWILGALMLFYLWKSDNLFRLASRLKQLGSQYEDEEDPIDVYGMVYGEVD